MHCTRIWLAPAVIVCLVLTATPTPAQAPVPQRKPAPRLPAPTQPTHPTLSIRVKPEGLFYAPHKQSLRWKIETVGGYEPITFDLQVTDSRISQPNNLGTSFFDIVKPSSGTSSTISGTGPTAPVISQPTLPTSGSITPPTIVATSKPAAPQIRDVRFKGLPDYSVGTGGLPVMTVRLIAVDATGRKAGATFGVQLTFATGPPVLHSLSLQGATPAAIVVTAQDASPRHYALDLTNWDSRDNPDLMRHTTSRIELQYPNGLIYQGSSDLRYTGSIGLAGDQCPASRLCRIRVPDLGLGEQVKVTLVNPYGRSQPITLQIPRPTIEITETENFSLPSNSTNATTSASAGPVVSSPDAGTCPHDFLVWKEIVFQDPSGRARLVSGGQVGTLVSSSSLPRWEFQPGPSSTSLQATYRMMLRSPICPGLVIN